MSRLHVEISPDGHGDWRDLGDILPGGDDGSVSHNPPDGGRQIIRFGNRGDHSVVQRSVAGADSETGPFRQIRSLGWETLATLRDGEHFETPVRTDAQVGHGDYGGTVRFTHHGDGT